MIRPARVEGATERLDEPSLDPARLEAGLEDVAWFNERLGGRRGLLRRLATLLPAGAPAEILDVGTGSGELTRAIAVWAESRGIRARITAVDRQPETVRIARRRLADVRVARVLPGDALALPFSRDAFDVAVFSLALHHIEGAARVRAIQELARVSRRGILISELERCWPNYLGARLLAATVWRGNPVTRHDGPLSVLRAFTRAELLELARKAGLSEPRVDRHWFHRLVLVSGG